MPMSNIYRMLSALRLTSKSYTIKFLFIAFLGIHIPLIGLVLIFASSSRVLSFNKVLFITLLLTLLATGVTLVILRMLLSPLHQSNDALNDYIHLGKVPNLPLHYNDEAGTLMKNVQKTIEQVEALLQQQRDLMSLLSHDVRSPLLGAIGLLDMTMQKQSEEQRKEDLKLLREELQKQLYYMDEMIVALRQESVQLKPEDFQEVEVNLIIDKAIDAVEIRYQDKGIDLHYFRDIQATTKVHPVLIHEVMTNILTNSLKFTPSGGRVLISVSTHRDECMIHVKDSGIGFDKKIEAQLFQRTAGAGRPGTEGEKSTGIGLFLSRKIIRQMGGDLIATSEGVDHGSTFTIILPLILV